ARRRVIAWRGLGAELCFFFQAEDGIRDFHVTGVQTCALPILDQLPEALLPALGLYFFFSYPLWLVLIATLLFVAVDVGLSPLLRSEERRVGEEGRPGGRADD